MKLRILLVSVALAVSAAWGLDRLLIVSGVTFPEDQARQVLARYRDYVTAPGEESALARADRTVLAALRRISRDYVLPVSEAEVSREAIAVLEDPNFDPGSGSADAVAAAAVNGVLQNYDPHSAYLDPATLGRLRDDTEGSYAGVGIVISQDDEGVVRVVSPIDDSPAARAGLQPNDRIVRIDGTDLAGQPIGEAVRLMRGPVGDPVTLTVKRGEAEILELTLRRARIEVPLVRAQRFGTVGYVRLSRFGALAAEQIETAVVDFLRGDPPLAGLILDLRRNPGGLLTEAVDVADLFLNDGVVVTTQGRGARPLSEYRARSGEIAAGVPLVVLIDGGSASGSELLAAALRDNGRAVLIGQRSFGKGSMQSVSPLPDGGAIKLTVGYYATPAGDIVQGVGVAPDLAITGAEADEFRREGDLSRALPNPGSAPPAAKVSIAADSCPAVPGVADADDPILGCAISYLEGGAIARYGPINRVAADR